MGDRCQIPVKFRKILGYEGISKGKCSKLPNSCWEDSNNNTKKASGSCYLGNVNYYDPCREKKPNSKDIGKSCYQALWSSAGCLQQPPVYNDKKKKMSYRQVEKEVEHYATSNDKYHFNMCYGGGDQEIPEKNPVPKVSHCSVNLPPTCQSSLDNRGEIVTCHQCAKYKPEDGGQWLVKNGKKTKIPSCQCPAAARAIKTPNLNPNFCSGQISVAKALEKYNPTQQKCQGVNETCQTSEDCCPGRLCREGLKKCLTHSEFQSEQLKSSKPLSEQVISKLTIKPELNNIYYQELHYGDKITLRNLNGDRSNYLATCGYDNICQTYQGVSTYTRYQNDYLEKHPTTGQWIILDTNYSTNSGQSVKYNDIILLKNVFSGRYLDTCGYSPCNPSSYFQVSCCPPEKAETTDKIAVRWKIMSPDATTGSTPTIVKQGDLVKILNDFRETSYLNTCGRNDNCGQGQFYGVNTCRLNSTDTKAKTSFWSLGLNFQDYLIDNKNYYLKTSSGLYLDSNSDNVKLVSSQDKAIAWQFTAVGNKPNTFYLDNQWKCGLDQNIEGCGQGIVVTTKAIYLTTDESFTELEFIQVAKHKFLIKDKNSLYLGVSGQYPILTTSNLAEVWEITEGLLTIGNILANYQTSYSSQDCELITALDNPEVKWFYAGKGLIKGINHSDGEIFYTTPEKIVVIPEGYCQAKCGSKVVNLCDQINNKIKNCRSNLMECRQATNRLVENRTKIRDITPSCFYHLPIEVGDLEKNANGQTSSYLKCDKSPLFNPNMVDTIVSYPKYIDVFRNTNVYRMSRHHDKWMTQKGFPKIINKVYQGVPDHLDASLPQYTSFQANQEIESIIFFKAENCYKYSTLEGKVTHRALISAIFYNVPDYLDSIIPSIWKDGQAITPTYFIKDTMCYLINLDRVIWGPTMKQVKETPTKDQLYLCDGPTNYSLTSQLAAKQLANQLGGNLVSQPQLEQYLAKPKVNISRQYAGWTLTSSVKTYYVAEGSDELIICGNPSCLSKGGAWCYLNPNKIILGGQAEAKSLRDVLGNIPNYLDTILSFPNATQTTLLYLFRGPELYTYNLKRKKVEQLIIKPTDQLFIGLPAFQEPLELINQKMCQVQYQKQGDLTKLETDYNLNTLTLTKGYDLIQKIQRNINIQDKHVHKNKQTLNEAEKNITTENRQTNNIAETTYRHNMKLFLLKLFLVLALLSLLGGLFVKITRGQYLSKKILIWCILGLLVIFLIFFIRVYYKMWRSNSNRLGKINWKRGYDPENGAKEKVEINTEVNPLANPEVCQELLDKLDS